MPNGARLYYLNRTQVRVGLFHIRHTLFGPITLTVYSYTLRNTDTFRLQSQPPVLASIVRLVYEARALRRRHRGAENLGRVAAADAAETEKTSAANESGYFCSVRAAVAAER